jgi:hypothetical protein
MDLRRCYKTAMNVTRRRNLAGVASPVTFTTPGRSYLGRPCNGSEVLRSNLLFWLATAYWHWQGGWMRLGLLGLKRERLELATIGNGEYRIPDAEQTADAGR